MSDYNDEIDEIESGSNGQIMELIMRDYVPYWPVIVVFALLGLFLGNAYLQTQIPVYRSTSKILLKDETQQSSESLLKQAVTGVNQSNVDGELEIITSANVMRDAAILAHAQVEYRWDGRIRTMYEDLSDLPFELHVDTFKTTSGTYVLDIFFKEKKIVFDGKEYALGKPFIHDGNRFNLVLKKGFNENDLEQYKSDSKHTFYAHVFDLESAATRMGEAFTATKDDKKEFLLSLSITNTNSKTGKRWLQSIIEAYQTETQLEKQKKNRYMMEFISDRLDYLGNDLDSIEKEMVSFQKETKLDFRTKTAEKVLNKVDSKGDITDDIETQLFMLDELEKYLKGQLKEPIMIPPAIPGVDVEMLNTGFMELYTLEIELSAIKQTLGEQSDKLRGARNQINLQKRVLTETVNNARKTLLVLRKKAENDIQLYYQEYERMMGDLPATELAFLEIKKQQEIKNALYTFLLQKREEAAIQVAGTTSDIKIIKEPGGSEQISPIPANIIGAFVGIAAALVFLVLFIKSSSNNTILSRSEIERRTKIPVIGEIIQTDTDTPLIMKEGNRSLVAEQFRALRTNLSYMGNDASKSTFLISSSFPGEGKSFVATNISIGYALAGKKTVIIESDLRKPNIAKHFNLSRRTGLSVYLSGNAKLEDIVFDVDSFANLFVIPAGPIPPNPVELILNGRYPALIEQLKKDYDHIIIDCPPIGLVTDAYEIGNFVDYALFITRHHYTPREAISGILDRSSREKKFKQSAIIMNGLKGGISGYGYGYNYGYGYGGYGYGYGYGYGQTYGYGYGYYGSEKKRKNRMLGMLWNVVIAPFGAFFGIKK